MFWNLRILSLYLKQVSKEIEGTGKQYWRTEKSLKKKRV